MKKLLLPFLGAMIIIGSNALAYTSSATITSSMTGANGATYSMTNYVDSSGVNNSTSTNQLWVELYKDVTGPDTRINGSLMAINGSASWRDTVATGNYYIHLDPDGALYSGCNGSGKAID